MLKKIAMVLCFSGSIVLFMHISCYSQERHDPGTPYYYGTWTGYHIPLKPSHPLTYEAAMKRTAYYVGYYDDQGRLVSFTEYVKGEILFSSKYYYRDSDILEREERIDENGETKLYYFDENGKPIK